MGDGGRASCTSVGGAPPRTLIPLPAPPSLHWHDVMGDATPTLRQGVGGARTSFTNRPPSPDPAAPHPHSHHPARIRLVGTPTAASWPGVDALPDFRLSFPRWPQRSPAHACPRLDAAGADLLGKLLTPDPSARISARDALRHPFLAGVA